MSAFFRQLTDIYSFITARQRMIFQKKFQDLDVDRNGKITLKELSQRMHEWVDKKEIKELMKVRSLHDEISPVKTWQNSVKIAKLQYYSKEKMHNM